MGCLVSEVDESDGEVESACDDSERDDAGRDAALRLVQHTVHKTKQRKRHSVHRGSVADGGVMIDMIDDMI